MEWRAARERLEDLDGWARRACRDTPIDPWFEPGAAAFLVEEFCRRCPVLGECREYGIEWEPEGTLGGLSQQERREVRRERQRAAGARLVAVSVPPVLDGVGGAVVVGEAA